MPIPQIVLTLPDWITKELDHLPPYLKTLEERMSAVLRFAQLNFEHDTGGPFAAGIFERDSGKLLTIGVNRVMAMNCSSAHAEVMALSVAQKLLGTYDLGAQGQPAHQIVINWRPCVLCYGAIIWSGVRSMVISGSGPELEDLTGFDEGPMHLNWKEELNKRGIEVVSDVLRAEACNLFRDFGKSTRHVYNSRLGEVSR